MPMTVDERLDMLQKASRSWVALQRMVTGLTPAQLTKPDTVGTWSGRDLIAHIAAWEEIAIDVIEQMEDGGPEEWPNDDDEIIDAFNAELLEPFDGMSLDEVRQRHEEIHFTLMSYAESAQSLRPDIILGVTTEHYDVHADDFSYLKS